MKRWPALAFAPLAALVAACSPGGSSSKDEPVDGASIYIGNCLTCHQVDGYGVPTINAQLVDNDVVKGDPTQLIRVVLKGPAAVLPADRPRFSNAMPPFEKKLSDAEIAAVLTYVRHDFGGGAPAITADEVSAVRANSTSIKSP